MARDRMTEPPGGVSAVVEPGRLLPDDGWLDVKAPCGLDYLKLVVTDHPLDLAGLAEPVRTRGGSPGASGPGGSLGRVLWSTGRTVRREGTAAPLQWAVRDLTVSVEPR